MNQLDQLINEYKEKAKNGDLALLKVSFISDKAKMELDKLRTPFTDNIADCEVVDLNVDKVVSKLEGSEEFASEQFFVDENMVRLIKFIEAGNNIIPPYLRYINGDVWKLMDGQHRVGLLRFLEITTAPFLIRRDQLKYVEPFKDNELY